MKILMSQPRLVLVAAGPSASRPRERTRRARPVRSGRAVGDRDRYSYLKRTYD